MKWCVRLIAVLALLSCTRVSHGLAMQQVGPDSAQKHPTTEQPGWPDGMIKLLGRDSRVYSIWVNGNENFYFEASPAEINELVRLFSQMRLRDHELQIKPGNPQIKSFEGDKISYNVNLHFLGGIARAVTGRDESPQTYEPTLTLYANPDADQAIWKQLTLPVNVILRNDVKNCPLKGKATKPKRKVRHAQVQFDDGTPAADFEHGVSTQVTLWEKDTQGGINLGGVNHRGYFHAAFSNQEIADLTAGKSWLTLTVGNGLTTARRDHPKLSVERFALEKTNVQPVTIDKPGFYHGRILFEDGSAPLLDPVPWPDAEIKVDFSYAGSAKLDPDGYFKVYFTKDQYESVLAKKDGKNIYVPSYEKKGRSSARFVFPVAKLSTNKQQAGVVKIARPVPKVATAE